MSLVLESFGFGLALFFMILGLVGVLVPVLPGLLLIWLTLLIYVILTGFSTLPPLTFTLLTLLAFSTGTAELWLPLLGARTGGASWPSLLFGAIGATVGFVVGNLLGAIAGYGMGIIASEYRKHGDWHLALKASLGGLAGWGVATAVQLGAGLLIIIVFIAHAPA